MKAANEMTAAEFRKARKRRAWIAKRPKEERSADGITFSSVAERRRYLELVELRRQGVVLWWARQPVFDLGGVQYRPDFITCWRSHAGPLDEVHHFVRVEEVKGLGIPPEILRRWKRNAKQMETLWGIKVELVQR